MKKKSKAKEKDQSKHDEQNCFRCRLYFLFEEMKETNKRSFMLITMAEACGNLLAQSSDEEIVVFHEILHKVWKEEEGERGPDDNFTKH
jgi:penicillin-binding protein-related factor A (putative recombinase)